MASTFNGGKVTFDYLFTAYFSDGHFIAQTVEDISTIDPIRSAYFDVLEYEKKSTLVAFQLNGINTPNKVLVDLRTGKFLINGLAITLGDQNFMPETKFSLVYFRENQAQRDINQASGEIVGERFYINRYFIGWRNTWKGKDYQETIALDKI